MRLLKSGAKEISGRQSEIKDYTADEEFAVKFGYVVDELKAYVDQPIRAMNDFNQESMFGDSPFVDLIHRIQLELTGNRRVVCCATFL